jgi:hypothetical protein
MAKVRSEQAVFGLKECPRKWIIVEAIPTLMNWSRNNIDFDYFIYPVFDRKNIASSNPWILGEGEIMAGWRLKLRMAKS